MYTSKPQFGDKMPGDLNRISYRPAPHQVIQMQSSVIRGLKSEAGESQRPKVAIPFDTYSGYFVSNKFEPNVAQSFVVISDQEQFDKVLGVGFVMNDKAHRLPKDAFKTLMVIATIKRGNAFWEYKVEGVTVDGGVVQLRYKATSKKTPATTFSCPLIVSIPKDKYKAMEFIEGDEKVNTVELDTGRTER